jgi:hypothetical protein
MHKWPISCTSPSGQRREREGFSMIERPNSTGIEKVKQKYPDDIKISSSERQDKASVTANVRQDLGVTEVLYDRAVTDTDRPPQWEISDWPLKKERKRPDGNVSGIGYATRHDPQKRYGGRGWRCSADCASHRYRTSTSGAKRRRVSAMVIRHPNPIQC